MWKRRRTWLVLAALSCVAVAVYFEPTHCVRGWLWGEAFFDGRPTSYWRSVVIYDLNADREGHRSPIWLVRVKASIGYQRDSTYQLICARDAEGVLRTLSKDENQAVAGFAQDLLKIQRNGPPEAPENQELWVDMMFKHRMRPIAPPDGLPD